MPNNRKCNNAKGLNMKLVAEKNFWIFLNCEQKHCHWRNFPDVTDDSDLLKCIMTGVEK